MAGSSQEIEAGRAFVKLATKDSDFEKGLKKAETRLKSFGGIVAGIGAGIGGLGGAVLTPLIASLGTFVERGTEIQHIADRLGISAEAVQTLSAAAKVSGAEMDTLGKAFFKYSRETGKGLDDFVKEIDALPGKANAAAAAFGMFGRSGQEVLQVARHFARLGGVGQFMEGKKATVLSSEDIENAEKLHGALNSILGLPTAIGMQLGAALGEQLVPFVDTVKNAVKATVLFAKEHRQLAVVVAAVGAGLVVAGGAVTAFGLAFIAAGAMINATLAIIKLMNPELLLVAAAVAVVVGAAAGLAYLWSTTETGRVAIKAFAADWKLAWGGISDAVKAGQLALAFKILFKTIELEWKRFWDSLWKEMNKGIGMIMPKGLDKNPLEGAVNAWAHGVPFIGQELRRFALKQAGEWTPEDEKEFKKRTDAILKEHGRIQNRMDKRADGIDPDIARLERELKDLRDKARQAVNAMPKKAAVETLKHGPMEVADLAQGTFSPYALGQSFGLANNKVTERIAKAAEATAENTKQMNDKLDDAGLNVD